MVKEESQRKKVDLYINALISYFLVLSIIITFINFKDDFENYIMLTILMIIALVSYYFNVTIALVLTLAIDFIYGTYSLYKNISIGYTINNTVYIWLILIPITSLIVSLVSKNILLLQNEVKKLEILNEELVMIDPLTGDRNIKAFDNEMPIYISMSKRYGIPITIMIVKFKYSDRLKTIVGKNYFNKILVKSSEVLSKSLRVEDRKYILNDNTFVYILISDNKGAKVIEKRLKKNISNIEMKNSKFKKNVNIEIQVGFYTYDGEVDEPLELLKNAEKELEYDL
ncbi:GGDEF domain-containing protein [Clostridium sp. MB05]|uniref:GGDEF domain-containing protein n=1 Tax=Clostridium sp. MB05 TaxID=3376682 RepID=UPI003981A589